jgi:hypothetical protein
MMKHFNGVARVGLRDKDTQRIIAVYPDVVQGTDSDIEDKVKFWFYQQSCGAEDEMRNYFVDTLTDQELKSYQS